MAPVEPPLTCAAVRFVSVGERAERVVPSRSVGAPVLEHPATARTTKTSGPVCPQVP